MIPQCWQHKKLLLQNVHKAYINERQLPLSVTMSHQPVHSFFNIPSAIGELSNELVSMR